MQDIFSVIKTKRAALERLQDELATLEKAAALLEGDAREPATREPATSEPAQRLYGAQAKGYFSPTSMVGLTIAVLKDNGSPLHVSDIIKRIEQRGHKVNKASLVGSLSRLVNERRVFLRQKPNVYGLMEWTRAAMPTRSPQGSGNSGSGSVESYSGSPASDSTPGVGWAARH